jgi:hypothetical protein
MVGAYDLEGLNSLSMLQRVSEIAMLDNLSMDNNLKQSRTRSYLVRVSTRSGDGAKAGRTGVYNQQTVPYPEQCSIQRINPMMFLSKWHK